MIEALILWGVLSGNKDRRDQYLNSNSVDETVRDNILLFFFFLTIVFWPVNIAVHTIRLAFAVKIWWLAPLAIIPLLTGWSLLETNNYLIYGAVSLFVCTLEMIRVGVRSISMQSSAR